MKSGTEAKLAGVRRFECDECDYKWDEPSRCCSSPSGEVCPNCGMHTAPILGLFVRGIMFNERGGVGYSEVIEKAVEQYPSEQFNFE